MENFAAGDVKYKIRQSLSFILFLLSTDFRSYSLRLRFMIRRQEWWEAGGPGRYDMTVPRYHLITCFILHKNQWNLSNFLEWCNSILIVVWWRVVWCVYWRADWTGLEVVSSEDVVTSWGWFKSLPVSLHRPSNPPSLPSRLPSQYKPSEALYLFNGNTVRCNQLSVVRSNCELKVDITRYIYLDQPCRKSLPAPAQQPTSDYRVQSVQSVSGVSWVARSWDHQARHWTLDMDTRPRH